MRAAAGEIAKAHHEPTRAAELPALREKFVEILDRVGLMDPRESVTPWRLLKEYDPALARYFEQHHETLLPKANEAVTPHTPHTADHQLASSTPVRESPEAAVDRKPDLPEDGRGAAGVSAADKGGEAPPGSVPSGPRPEFTDGERAQHWQHLDQVEAAHPVEFDHLQRDPDKNGGISEPSKDEARVGLDLREQGRLPQDIQRPAQADRGEFYSPSAGRYYDIKGVHSDWPPFNNVRDKSKPFKGAYDPAKNSRWVDKLREQIEEKDRTVIIDLRNANQVAIDDILLIVQTHGWDDYVIWYP